MTQEEIGEREELKAAVTARLAAAKPGRMRLGRVDARLSDYVRDVAARPQAHNLWEQMAVERFMEMVDKYGISASKVRRFFAFYESLKFPGAKGLTTYSLTPVQCFQFASIWGFWEGDRRVVREACLYVPRKFSKTTSTAALAVWDLLYGESNAECYTGANSADQAKKCFDVIRGCVRSLDPRGVYYRVNQQQVLPIRADRQAFAQCLTANARTKDGLNASTVIMDEFSQARDAELLNVLTTSMGARRNPLTVVITTASTVFDGPFYGMLDGYKRLLMGEYRDDRVFAHLFEPDAGDPEGSPATWHKVHPHIGVTVSEEFYRAEWDKARRSGAEAMTAFRTKLLNVYTVNERACWITPTEARKASVDWRLEDLPKGLPAWAGLDLAVSGDFSAVTIGVYDRRGGRFFFHTAYFFPEDALPGHPNEMLYRAWAQAGHLRLTHGPVLAYRDIVEYVMEAARHVSIRGIGYDPYKSREVINMLEAAGGKGFTRKVSQTYGNFTSSVETFEHGMKTGRILINSNPINLYCFGNAVLDEDGLENQKPVKRTRNGKIDGVVTMLMCLRQFLDDAGDAPG